jgi:hypothetical protein
MMTMKTQVATVTNRGNGLSFNVVVVAEGDAYGLNDCKTHGEEDPLVEFYDARYPHTEHGQFVSRYCLSTLLGKDGFSSPVRNAGLNLDGGVDDWSIDRAAVNAAMDAVEAHLAPAPTVEDIALENASKLIGVAHDLNDVPALEGAACRAAFAAARAVLNDAGLDGDAIVERAVSSGEWTVADLGEGLV